MPAALILCFIVSPSHIVWHSGANIVSVQCSLLYSFRNPVLRARWQTLQALLKESLDSFTRQLARFLLFDQEVITIDVFSEKNCDSFLSRDTKQLDRIIVPPQNLPFKNP